MTDLETKEKELEKWNEKKTQAEHRLTRLVNRLSHDVSKKNKARNHRLIVEGAELEYVFEGIETIPQNDFRRFMNELCELPQVVELYSKYINTVATSISEGGEV